MLLWLECLERGKSFTILKIKEWVNLRIRAKCVPKYSINGEIQMRFHKLGNKNIDKFSKMFCDLLDKNVLAAYGKSICSSATLNMSKWTVFSKKVVYLGHVIRTG